MQPVARPSMQCIFAAAVLSHKHLCLVSYPCKASPATEQSSVANSPSTKNSPLPLACALAAAAACSGRTVSTKSRRRSSCSDVAIAPRLSSHAARARLPTTWPSQAALHITAHFAHEPYTAHISCSACHSCCCKARTAQLGGHGYQALSEEAF